MNRADLANLRRDYAGKELEAEFGVGFGLNDASDDLTLKLILSRDFN